ncbi:adhesion G-protein coupled receptor G6-like [Bradysia coprophila]|uniref:adhesion G-protein coupled receptor G6-like n=1 Tax=Bradysia coprophila TaxID=38358 RepID=UPI00187DA6BF|nr:adhesion G-protein coupled receptor G6-like [Bradysia coprophila]
MVCLYNQLEPTMLSLSCPEGYRTTRYATFQNVCIKITKFAEPISPKLLSDDFVRDNICENVFSINSGSTLYIFQELAHIEKISASDRCLFKAVPDKVLISANDWMEMDMSQIDFVNWSFNASIPRHPDNHILVASLNGTWIWEDSVVTCAICFVENEILTPTIELHKYDKSNLIVRIQNEESLWRNHRRSAGFSCFAFVYAQNQIKTVDFVYQYYDGSAKIYHLATVGEGRYWCSGLQIRSFDVIETEIIHIQRLTQFAILVERPRPTLPSYEVSHPSIVRMFRNFLASFMDPKHLMIENVSLNLTTSDAILFHVRVLIQSDAFREFEENRLNISDTLLAVYYVREQLNEIRLSTNESSPFNILSLNSTAFCLPASISQLNEINWAGARLGQYSTSLEFCLLLNGLPVTKRCIGDSLFGGVWVPIPERFECRNDLQSMVTYNLHNLTNSYLTSENTSQVLFQMVEIVFDSDYAYLISADVFYVSQILMDVANYMQTYPLSDDDVLEVLRLYDRLLMVNESITVSAAPLNTTNVLLNTLDTILDSVTWSDLKYYDLEIDDGVASFIQPRLSSFVIYPSLTNITGVAVTSPNGSTTHEWTEYAIQYLYQNDTIADILSIPNLVIGSYIPAALLSRLDNPNVYIIITLFINDVLFQIDYDSELSDRYASSSGSIISIILPGVTEILPHKLPIFLKPNERNSNDSVNVCGYWNYVNGWAINGCEPSAVTSTTVLCECTHLTHFAYLFHGHNSIPPEHIKTLNLITLIGCSISLFGIFGIYLSAILFRQWRKLCSTKFLLQFSTAISFEMIMLAFVNTQANSLRLLMADNIVGCIALGAFLHYSVLVTFFWMLIIAYMQYMRYVIVFHKLKTSHFFFKSSLLGWTIPIIPILLVLLLDPMSYVPNIDYYSNKICYPTGYSLYFAVMMPISFFTFANFVIFFLVIKSLASESDLVRRNRDKSSIMSQLRLSIFLFFLLGLTWIFAFLSTATTGLVFTYMFCLTATLQGFILFFYFIVMDPVVRRLWIGLFSKLWLRKK